MTPLTTIMILTFNIPYAWYSRRTVYILCQRGRDITKGVDAQNDMNVSTQGSQDCLSLETLTFLRLNWGVHQVSWSQIRCPGHWHNHYEKCRWLLKRCLMHIRLQGRWECTIYAWWLKDWIVCKRLLRVVLKWMGYSTTVLIGLSLPEGLFVQITLAPNLASYM
jgi:hypothetical protein